MGNWAVFGEAGGGCHFKELLRNTCLYFSYLGEI